jgi:SnoaL-like domain
MCVTTKNPAGTSDDPRPTDRGATGGPGETADADEVVDLFTPGASYQPGVFREPYVGRDAIRQHWQRGAGTQRDVTVRMGRPVTTDAHVAAEWWTTMTDPDEGEIQGSE